MTEWFIQFLNWNKRCNHASVYSNRPKAEAKKSPISNAKCRYIFFLDFLSNFFFHQKPANLKTRQNLTLTYHDWKIERIRKWNKKKRFLNRNLSHFALFQTIFDCVTDFQLIEVDYISFETIMFLFFSQRWWKKTGFVARLISSFLFYFWISMHILFIFCTSQNWLFDFS